ncbi:ABC transporter ATP-binding protein [Dongia sedimenti]|uniref:ABC transporter ATP-binding protein n=1 Tax=Dongia sedimenti TaxID=3064282 RepID=A0ABU0YI73_9PROT|nr:ABC transporter ATP-binding protein [Rhodospirillaceae bacterium R-7]
MRTDGMLAVTPIIEITAGQKSFGSMQVLHDIDLAITPGEIVTLLGPSGCGKTTLMRLIAGFEDMSGGGLRIDGRDMKGIAPEHRPVNMVFQRYALFPHLDVFENVAFGLKVKGLRGGELRERVQRMLKIVQLDNLANRYIDELSGGQCQRVALARALVNEPKVLLLDEPLAALDLKIRQLMLEEMKRIHAETKATFVYVTHDQDEAMILSDRIVLMDRGRIVQVDRPEVMYAHPRTLFAAKFLGETNLFEGRIVGEGPEGLVVHTEGGVTFTVRAEAPSRGPEVVVSIRPESFSFDPATGDGRHSVSGRVEDIVFTGSRSFYTVALQNQRRIRVQVQRSAKHRMPARGAEVALFWDHDDVAVLPIN